MKKIIGLLCIIFLLTACGNDNISNKAEDNHINTEKKSLNNSEKTYLKYFDGEDSKISKINIECSTNLDCKLEKLAQPCGGFTSINISNTKGNIQEFNSTQTELLENFNFDCMIPLQMEDFVAICTNHICDYN